MTDDQTARVLAHFERARDPEQLRGLEYPPVPTKRLPGGLYTPDEVYSTYPAFRDAVEPEPPAVKPDDYVLHGPSEAVNFMLNLPHYRFREPVGPVLGPFCGFGDCLVPFALPMDADYFAPQLSARDGDVVLAMWGPEGYRYILEDGDGDRFIERFGFAPPILAQKILVSCAGEYWLVQNDGMTPLGDNRILGVLVRKERRS